MACVKKNGCWERFIVAGRFSGSYVCCASDQSPVVVLLENKYFKVLAPPSVEGTEGRVPNAWLRETPTIALDLAGGMFADDPADDPGDFSRAERDGDATPSLQVNTSQSQAAASVVRAPSLEDWLRIQPGTSSRPTLGMVL